LTLESLLAVEAIENPLILDFGVLMLIFDNALDLTEKVEPPPIDKTALALSAI
jgi:hypothetical protein